MRGGGYSPRFNFDGVLNYVSNSETQDGGHSYLQLFRDGKVECVDTLMPRPKEQFGRMIPSLAAEAASITCLARIFKLLSILEVEPPAVVMLTLLGVKSYTMGLDYARTGTISSEVDRDALVIAPEAAESYDPQSTISLMRTIFDALWNATGLSRCGDYDGAGQPTRELQTAIQNMG